MLAQAQAASLPEPSHYATLGWLLVSLGGLAVVLNQGYGFLVRVTGKEGHRNVTIQEGAVSKVDCVRCGEENRRVHEQLFANISGKERGLRDEFGRELRELRSSLDHTSSACNELKGEIKQLSIQLVNLQQQT